MEDNPISAITKASDAFYDIYDPPGYIHPSLQDFLLTDITENVLSDVAGLLEVEYLAPSVEFPVSFPVSGSIFGINQRLMVSLPCRMFRNDKEAINVIFLVNTGSPYSYLSKKAMIALVGSSEIKANYAMSVYINSELVIDCHLSPPDKQFADVNVLGMDFLFRNNLSLILDYQQLRFQLSLK